MLFPADRTLLGHSGLIKILNRFKRARNLRMAVEEERPRQDQIVCQMLTGAGEGDKATWPTASLNLGSSSVSAVFTPKVAFQIIP